MMRRLMDHRLICVRIPARIAGSQDGGQDARDGARDGAGAHAGQHGEQGVDVIVDDEYGADTAAEGKAAVAGHIGDVEQAERR